MRIISKFFWRGTVTGINIYIKKKKKNNKCLTLTQAITLCSDLDLPEREYNILPRTVANTLRNT